MESTGTSNIYIHVIEDVINKVRDEFVSDGGPGDDVLAELQGIWELKMMHAGAILGPIDRSAKQKAAGGPVTPNPVHDLNVPYEGTEEYETPTADMLFPPTPLQTPMQTPLPGMAQTPLPGTAQTPLPGTAQTPLPGNDSSPYYSIPTGGTPITPNEYSSNNDNGGEGQMRTGGGRPSQYMQPPSTWLSQRPPLDVNVGSVIFTSFIYNLSFVVAYVEGREEGDKGAPNHPPTQVGVIWSSSLFQACNECYPFPVKDIIVKNSMQDFFLMPSGKRKREDIPPQYHSGGYIPQQDGAGDVLPEVLKVGPGSIVQIPVQKGSLSCRIPQLDGPIPDPYDDALSTPNILIATYLSTSFVLLLCNFLKGYCHGVGGLTSVIYNYQGVINEDYNIVNTPMPNDMQAATLAPIPNEPVDDDDDEPLNEDDDDELDDLEQGEDVNTAHLVLAQFDKVTRTKSRWKCTLKDGIMRVNNKDILFNKWFGYWAFTRRRENSTSDFVGENKIGYSHCIWSLVRNAN
ncbi:hypothetical protein SASPL_101106 [Salvia splendens]|uniref:Transcription initiation factor TFIIA large subunit n=1 Tax=Salvia splendens TaxID=180675 RepID=A0A8X8YPH8_SALSN|nr:hypothetical protein SASPL_101106 [Salvia splendens]